MLDYRIINYKPTVTRNNEEYLDLLCDVFNKDELITGYPIIVNEYYVARPDLVSLAVYGDDRYGDIICKVNGISNPFELNEDDMIFIPNIDYINECVKASKINSDFINDPKTDTIELKDTNNYQKKKNEVRSPNEQTLGDDNYIIDKSLGVVFY
jgi:hypothetical protein